MLIPSEIARALERLPDLREYDRFQEMAFHIARSTWKGLRLTRKVHDRSADAIDNAENLALACGWEGGFSKLKHDCRGLKANRPNVKKVVFATSLAVEEAQVLKWKKAVKTEFNLELVDVLHRDSIVGELTRPANRWIAHQYLRLPVGDFADLDTYLPRIKNAATRIISAWRAEYLSHQDPVFDLRVALVGEDLLCDWPPELRLDDLCKGIRRGDFIWILGPPGSGKTHLLLSLAERLASGNTVIPVLIQIRNWGMQGGRLLDQVAAEPAMQLQGITAQTLATALEAGHIALLLNGWNEVSEDQKRRIAVAVQSLVSQFQASTLVCTSRSTPSLRASRAHTDVRVQELSDNEILDGFVAAQVPDAKNAARETIGNPRIAELARVPLFLWELAREVKAGRSIPRTRFELLRRLIERASQEHEDLLTIADVSGLAPRFLSALARRMTDRSLTMLPTGDARRAVAEMSSELNLEGALAAPPAPPVILQRLFDGHLLFLVHGNLGVRFSHQLVQEYFAAIDLTRTVEDFPDQSLTAEAWDIPIQLAIEGLCRGGDFVIAARFVARLANSDLEAACRAAGANPELWQQVREKLKEAIRHLINANDVNASWLAARCAAATGEPEFAGCVFSGLAGHPPGSESCFTGIPVDTILRSLGPDLPERVVQSEDVEFRLLALRQLTENSAGVDFAEKLATSDRNDSVRMLAYQVLFGLQSIGHHRKFAREVKRQGGWTPDLLAIAMNCPEVSQQGWQRRIARFLKTCKSVADRARTLNILYSRDPQAACVAAESEYEWCKSRKSIKESIGDDQLRGYRRFSLRRASHQDAQWAGQQVLQEIEEGGLHRLDELPVKCLTDEQAQNLVTTRLSTALLDKPELRKSFKQLAELSPEVAARVLLKELTMSDFHLSDQHAVAVQEALSALDRKHVLSVACEPEFERPSPPQLPGLIDSLMRSRPESALPIAPDLAVKWRARLQTWTGLLAQMGQETAPVWPSLALLIAELANPEDASQILSWLHLDRERVISRQSELQAKANEYRASGGKTAPPGPFDICSYQLTYRQALWQFVGPQVAEQVKPLLDDPREFGFAANWLCHTLGCPAPDGGAFSYSLQNYREISSRRARSSEFQAAARPIAAHLKAAIDRFIAADPQRHKEELVDAFCAVARLEGASAGAWITERIERSFGDFSWAREFNLMTLLGASFEATRLLPFVRNTIHKVLHPEYYPAPDQTFAVVDAIAALLYSNAPELAIQILENEAASVFERKEHETAKLLQISQWVSSPCVDAWLKSFLASKNPERLRVTAFHVSMERLVDRQAYDDLPGLASEFVGLGDLQQSEGNWSIPRRVAELLQNHPEIRSRIITDALSAKSITEAQRWLCLLAWFETEESVLTELRLTERWGESNLGVVSSISPLKQERSHLQFSGCRMHPNAAFYRAPTILSTLNTMTSSADETLRVAAQKALFWLERERLKGSP